MKNIRKFVVALGIACGVAGTALADGQVDGNEAITIVLAFLGALGVYVVPNLPAPSGLVDRDGNPVPRDPGQSSVALICIVIVAVLLALLLFRALAI